MENRNKRIIGFLALLLIIGILTFLIPQSIGLGAGGFDSAKVLTTFSFYLIGGFYMFLIFIMFILTLLIKKDDSKYGNSLGFFSIGENPSLKFFKRFTPFQLSLYSIIIFLSLGLFNFLYVKQQFADFTSLEQQFTPTAQLIFSALLIPGAENLGLAVVIGFSFFSLRYIARRINMTKETYRILGILIPVTNGGIYWVINHLLRYSDSSLSLMKVFLFGVTQSLLVVITGFYMIGYFLHQISNFLIDIQSFYSSDNIVILLLSSIVLLIIIALTLYRGRLLGVKR